MRPNHSDNKLCCHWMLLCMLLFIPKPSKNINEGMLGICCKDPGVDEFGIYWTCGYTSHFFNSGEKYEVPGMQNIPNSQKISFPFKNEPWFGGLIWILGRKKEGIAWGWSKYFIFILWKCVLRSIWNENVIVKWGAENASMKIEAETFQILWMSFFFSFFSPTEALYDILTWSCD